MSTRLQILAIFVNFFFPALAFIFVSARAVGRLTTRQFGLDDWLVCIAMVMSIAETIISYFFIKTNFVGVPADQVPPHDPTEGLIWLYAVQILYNPILALVKSSVLIFMSRLFGHKKGVARLLLWINVANISQMVAVFFAIALQCLPVPFNWDPTIRNGRCIDRRVLYVSTSSFNIVTDLLIIGIPLYILKGLKIPRRTKIALFFVFLLGFLVTITSVVRLVLLLQGLFNLRIFSEPTSSIGFVSSGIEINLALVTASIPALWPFFRSKERGGLFTRKSVAPTQIVDEEKGIKSVGWDSPPPVDARSAANAGKLGRGGSRGGRRGSERSVRSTRNARGGKTKPIIRVRTDVQKDGTQLRSQSPRPSQEEAMTNNGIMRISDIQREIDGIAREIAATGSGAYIERPSTAGTPSGGFTFGSSSESPPRPSTSGQDRKFPERYYSESVYPDLDYDDREIRDYNSDRFSRYGDRRFGVVTPKGTTPTAPTWRQAGAGRPF